MRAALYIRVSTADQNTELQVRELRSYAGPGAGKHPGVCGCDERSEVQP